MPTGRRICGCPSRKCFCGGNSSSILPDVKSSSAIKKSLSKGGLLTGSAGFSIRSLGPHTNPVTLERWNPGGLHPNKTIHKIANIRATTTYSRRKSRGPGTGRRACGCPSRLCTCGAAALLSLQVTNSSGEGTSDKGESPTIKSPCYEEACESVGQLSAQDTSVYTGDQLKVKLEVDREGESQVHASLDLPSIDNMAGEHEPVAILRKRQRSKRKRAPATDIAQMKARVKNQLQRIRLEQSYLDIYEAEGWKGRSRERIRPQSELARATMQIVRSKLLIRRTLEQLCQLSLEGAIKEDAFDVDGQISHEQIFCAKCATSDVTKDNDIILCDGVCSRGFHQKCLVPPLATADIPPGDEGWLCPVCDCKMDCINAINADANTNFGIESSWEEIFVEATESAGASTLAQAEEDWPSDDSEDKDYEGEDGNEQADSNNSNGFSGTDSSEGSGEEDDDEDDDEAEDMDQPLGTPSDIQDDFEGVEGSAAMAMVADDEDMEIEQKEIVRMSRRSELKRTGRGRLLNGAVEDNVILTHKRKRQQVDYKQLYKTMFGAEMEEGNSDDDWGPHQPRRKPTKRASPFPAGAAGTAATDPVVLSEDDRVELGHAKGVSAHNGGQAEVPATVQPSALALAGTRDEGTVSDNLQNEAKKEVSSIYGKEAAAFQVGSPAQASPDKKQMLQPEETSETATHQVKSNVKVKVEDEMTTEVGGAADAGMNSNKAGGSSSASLDANIEAPPITPKDLESEDETGVTGTERESTLEAHLLQVKGKLRHLRSSLNEPTWPQQMEHDKRNICAHGNGVPHSPGSKLSLSAELEPNCDVTEGAHHAQAGGGSLERGHAAPQEFLPENPPAILYTSQPPDTPQGALEVPSFRKRREPLRTLSERPGASEERSLVKSRLLDSPSRRESSRRNGHATLAGKGQIEPSSSPVLILREKRQLDANGITSVRLGTSPRKKRVLPSPDDDSKAHAGRRSLQSGTPPVVSSLVPAGSSKRSRSECRPYSVADAKEHDGMAPGAKPSVASEFCLLPLSESAPSSPENLFDVPAIGQMAGQLARIARGKAKRLR